MQRDLIPAVSVPDRNCPVLQRVVIHGDSEWGPDLVGAGVPPADGAAPPTPKSNGRPALEVAVGRHWQETRLLIQGEVDLSTPAQFSGALAVGFAVGVDRLVVDLRSVAVFDRCGLEIPKTSTIGLVGFIIAWVVVAALIATVYWIFSLARQ